MLFRELRSATQTIHGDAEATAGRRGLLSELLTDGPATVPALAGRRHVSRQHIQVLVNRLVEEGLVSLEPNPRHKRSRLVTITALGRKTASDMLAKEKDLLRRFPAAVAPKEVAQASAVLRRVTEAFRSDGWREMLTTEE